MNKDTENLLKEAVIEIKELRSANEIMAIRLQMFDDMMLLFRSSPQLNGRGMKEDVVYKIEKHIAAANEKDNSK